jgi:Na+-driven multidrug efflux pump
MKIPKLFPLKFEKRIIKPVIIISIPICLENIFFNMGKMVTQVFAVPFGTNAIAVNGIANTISTLVCVGGSTAANAVTPIVGRYVGMRNFKQARLKNRQFLYLTTILAFASSALMLLLIPPLAKFYSSNVDVQHEIFKVAGSYCLMYILFWAPSFMTPSGLRGAGDVRYTTYVSVVSMLIVRIGVGYLFSNVLGFGVLGIWIGMYSDWLVRGTFFLWREHGNQWLQKSVI